MYSFYLSVVNVATVRIIIDVIFLYMFCISCIYSVFQMNVSIMKNPGLGFSVAGGVGLQGNPYKPQDEVSRLNEAK